MENKAKKSNVAALTKEKESWLGRKNASASFSFSFHFVSGQS
jgi:hypothetical protein